MLRHVENNDMFHPVYGESRGCRLEPKIPSHAAVEGWHGAHLYQRLPERRAHSWCHISDFLISHDYNIGLICDRPDDPVDDYGSPHQQGQGGNDQDGQDIVLDFLEIRMIQAVKNTWNVKLDSSIEAQDRTGQSTSTGTWGTMGSSFFLDRIP